MTAIIAAWIILSLCGATFFAWLAAADGPGHAVAAFFGGAILTAGACALGVAVIAVMAAVAVLVLIAWTTTALLSIAGAHS